MVSVNGILVGSKWVCDDEDYGDRFGMTCEVLEVHDEPGYNGDGEIGVLYEDGREWTMKVRRFMVRHSRKWGHP